MRALRADSPGAAPIYERDDHLVRACLQGDSHAWETLIGRYERLIYAIPRRSGMDTDQAADVFQDVCLALHRGLPKLKSSRALTTWIQRTTQRITRDHRVKAARTSSLDEARETGGVPELADPSPLTPDVLEELEIQHHLRAQLARMDERCRRLLLMLFYTDPQPSYTEIARELGIAGGSVGPTRARCFEKLRKNLERPGS